MSTSYQLDTATGMSSIILMLDSEDATAYYMTNAEGGNVTSYFSKTLQTPIVPPHGSQTLVSLYSCTIPYSWYNIRPELNDTVDLFVTDLDGTSNRSAEYSFTLPKGNYGATALRQALVNGTHAQTGIAVNVGFDPLTYKLSFSTAHATRMVHLDFEGTHRHVTPYKEMGFNPVGQKAIKAGSPLSSENVIDVSGSVHGLYINTNLTDDSVINSKGVASNIISRVPIDVPNGGLIFHQPSNSTHRHLVGNRVISQVVCQLTDTRGRILDLNGLQWQIQIAFDFVPDKPRVHRPIGSLRSMMDALVDSAPAKPTRVPRKNKRGKQV